MAGYEKEERLLEALHHPLRRSLLRRYLNSKETLGPKQLAQLEERPLSTLSYHVRVLARYGLIEVVEEEQVRGSVAHFYEATPLVRQTPWVLASLGIGEG